MRNSGARRHRTIAGAFLAASFAFSQPQAADHNKVDLRTWDQSPLQRGWRATTFLDSEVYGQDGEQIGKVEDFHIDADGRLTTLIVEAGGVLDIGDVHLAVPWNQVKKWPQEDGVAVPINSDNLPDFSLSEEDVLPAAANWRLTDLIGDVVYLAGDRPYGKVEDLIVGPENTVEALVVDPDIAFPEPDRRALPWQGAAYDAAEGRYDLPYELREIKLLGPFENENRH